MTISLRWLLLSLSLCSGAVGAAAEVGALTLVEGSARVLHGVTWYKAATGLRIEETDIIEASDRTQIQLELGAGIVANLVGPGSIYLAGPPAKGATPRLATSAGWLKIAARAPGLRLRTTPYDLALSEGIVVLRANGAAVDFFVESGSARIIELTPSGADATTREAKRGEYWSKSAAGTFTTVPRAPKTFVDAMPKHFFDALPVLATKLKSKPALVADRDISYVEAEPWLSGRDRAIFERRFASRLRDPAFRSAALPNIARYPTWDRMLHPEKYAPKTVPPK